MNNAVELDFVQSILHIFLFKLYYFISFTCIYLNHETYGLFLRPECFKSFFKENT